MSHDSQILSLPTPRVRAAQFIISEPFRTVYVGVPKVASSTLLDLFMRIHGLGDDVAARGRPAYRNPAFKQMFADAGLSKFWARDQEITRTVERCTGYYFFCFVRNPYARLYSNYNNKLNRYAQQFDRTTYYLGKLAHLQAICRRRSGPKAAIARMQRRIRFPNFVAGLADQGIDWDAHYTPQADLLCQDLIPYDYIGKLESFDDDLSHIKSAIGIDAGERKTLPMQNRNVTGGSSKVDALLDDSLRDIISRLYRDDFDSFGYACGTELSQQRRAA